METARSTCPELATTRELVGEATGGDLSQDAIVRLGAKLEGCCLTLDDSDEITGLMISAAEMRGYDPRLLEHHRDGSLAALAGMSRREWEDALVGVYEKGKVWGARRRAELGYATRRDRKIIRQADRFTRRQQNSLAAFGRWMCRIGDYLTPRRFRTRPVRTAPARHRGCGRTRPRHRASRRAARSGTDPGSDDGDPEPADPTPGVSRRHIWGVA